jgi:SMI1 / KNR4 family (SUKH-1)
MSQLTNTLDRIQTWLKSNYPIVAEFIPSGLTIEEIREITSRLPFTLPKEVNELYQWSRGHNKDTLSSFTSIFDPYEGMSHSSLQLAIETQTSFENLPEELALEYISKQLFPLFELEGSYLCVIRDYEDNKSSPVILVSQIGEITIRYSSLTSMMQTIAESFESGAFHFHKNGYSEWNEGVFSPIYVKYNSDILKFSIARLKQELTIRKDSKILSRITKSNFEGDICYLGRERLYLETNQFDIEIIRPLITAMQDDNEIVRDLAKRALEELNYDFE